MMTTGCAHSSWGISVTYFHPYCTALMQFFSNQKDGFARGPVSGSLAVMFSHCSTADSHFEGY